MHSNSSLLALLVALCSVCAVIGNSYPAEFTQQVQNYPNVITESSRCLPIKVTYRSFNNYVCDPDQVLTVMEINNLNSLIEDIRSNINRGEVCNSDRPRPSIAIAIVKEMKIGQKKNEEVLQYASVFNYYLYDEWKLLSDCSGSDKIVIFYSVNDGTLYTYAGTGLSDKLPSKTIIDVSVASKPYFGNKIAPGLTYLLDRYRKIFTGQDKKPNVPS